MAIQQQNLDQLNTNTWKKIYETTLTEAATRLTISNLNGDVDEEYMLIGRIAAGADTNRMGIRPNNDTGNNYGYQMLWGISSSPGAERGGWNRLALDISGAQTGEISFVKCLLYAKSGYVRTALASSCDGIATTTVTGANLIGSSWNNTADNITSLVIFSDQANRLGIGTVIELYKKI